MLRSNASLYIHGHSAGGTNPSLVEAMYLGLPILAYGVSYNRVTTENKALYFDSAKGLISHLENIYSVKLQQLGQTMQDIAHRRYTWAHIAKKYQFLLGEVFAFQGKPSVTANISNLPYDELLGKGLAHLKTTNTF